MRELGEQVHMQPLYGSHFTKAVSSSMFAAPTTCDGDGAGMGCYAGQKGFEKYQKPRGLKSIGMKSIGKSQLPKEMGEDIRPMPSEEDIIPGEQTPEDISAEETFEYPGEQTVQEENIPINPNADKSMPPRLPPQQTTTYPPYNEVPVVGWPPPSQSHPYNEVPVVGWPPSQSHPYNEVPAQQRNGFFPPDLPIEIRVAKWVAIGGSAISILAAIGLLVKLLRKPKSEAKV